MEQRLIQLKKLFENVTFNYAETGDKRDRKTYYCEKVEFVAGNFKIITVSRTFVKKDFELDAFIERCEFVQTSAISVPDSSTEVEVLKEKASIEKVSDSLLDMFEKVCQKGITKEELERAKVMIGLSNQIVSVEKIKLGYRNLKLN